MIIAALSMFVGILYIVVEPLSMFVGILYIVRYYNPPTSG